MTKHYAIAEFFRQAPNAMLARYFTMRGHTVVGYQPWPDAEHAKWLALVGRLPGNEQSSMEAEFQEIHAMSTEKGFVAIRDELGYHLDGDEEKLTATIQTLGEMANHYERAFTVFLDHHQCWQGATRFLRADSLGYWTKRKGFPGGGATTDKASLGRLSDALSEYYQRTQGRGRNCHVEAYRRGAKDLVFAYPEDHSQKTVEWVQGTFGPRPHTPAFEVVFVYDRSAGTLDISAKGGRRIIEALQGLFAKYILHLDDLPLDPEDNRVYDLSPLASRFFDFEVQAGSEVDYVRVKRIRFSSETQHGERITLEASPKHKPKAVYDLIDAVSEKLKKGAYAVDQVDLTASLQLDADKPPRSMSFKLSLPNHCSLKYDRASDMVRDVLEASGIEPKAKGSSAAASPSPVPAPRKAKPAPSA